jgi:predicted permease
MDWKDLRFGLRMLAQQPAFTAVAVLTLALGIGANTAIFTLFNAILLQSLPVRDPARLVLFNDGTGEGTSTTTSPPTGRWTLFSFESYEFLRDQSLPFEGLAAVRSGESPVSARLGGIEGQQAQRAQAHPVSGNYFAVLGVDAVLGRTLTPDDDRPNAAPVAVVSHGFWTDRLHADPAIVGKTAILNGTAFTIVGVTPREFFGERVRRPPDFWVPLTSQPQIEVRPSFVDRTDAYWLSLIGRLKPGATRVQAQGAATGALQHFLGDKEGAKLTDERRREIKESRVELVDGAAGVSSLRYLYSEPLRMLLAVVALVLALACANVGNLLLSRAAARRAELTVRMALGAARGRIIRQLLTESCLLAILGAICGIVLARWSVSVLIALMASKTTPVHATLDARVLGFTILVTVLAAILFGLAPALSGARTDLVAAMKGGAARGTTAARGRLTQALVVAQIAISLVLLVGASLFARSLLNLEQQPLGFDQDHVLLARLNPRLAGYKPNDVAMLHRRLYDRIATMAGIRSATLARYSPLGGSNSVNSASVEGYTPKPDESVQLETQIVAPSYPETLGMPLVKGRAIGLQDTSASGKVAMVNEAFVRHFFGDQNPIGRHVGFGTAAERPIEIVGVLRDARFHDDRQEVKPIVFTALLQEATQFALDVEVEVRTIGDPFGVAAALRQTIAQVDPNLPVNDPKTLRDQVSANFDSQRLAARLVGAFGVLALLLAAVGLYGVVTQGVARRTNEIGVRMALGAERRDVVGMVLGEIVVLLGIGLVIGIPVALAAMRLVASQLYGLSTAAPLAFALAIVILSIVALGTGLFPARRAASVDPMVALRYE